MSLSELCNVLKQKEDKLQKLIAQSLANHNGLLGMLKATQETAHIVNTIIHAAAPESPLAEGLETANNVLEAVEAAIPESD